MDRAQAGQEPSELQRAVACVDREIRMRLAAYPRWVAQKKLTQKKADEELEGMRLVRRLLIHGQAAAGVMGLVDPVAVATNGARLEREFPPSP